MQANQAVLSRGNFYSFSEAPKSLSVPWQTLGDVPLTATSLDDLFQNRIPAVRVRGFASGQECAQLTSIIENYGKFEGYSYEPTAATVQKIGTAQCEFKYKPKAEYFKKNEKVAFLHQKMRELAFSPLDRVMSVLRQVSTSSVSIAREENHGDYFAGVMRNISRGAMLHMDFAKYDGPDWSIGEVAHQLSWNLYIRGQSKGGECVVHNRPWKPEYEAMKVDGSYHYNRAVVEGAEAKSNPFVEGDLVLFNSRNFHEVGDSQANRITMSSFIGRFPNQDVVLWS